MMKRERITLPIDNLSCGSAPTIEHALAKTPGVIEVYVNPLTEMAYILYDPTIANVEQMTSVIEQLGYGPPLSNGRIDQAASCTQIAAPIWHSRWMAFLGGSFFAAMYISTMVFDLLFPNQFRLYQVWEVVLLGVHWASPWNVILGLIEVFLLGTLAIWGIILLSSHVPRRLPTN